MPVSRRVRYRPRLDPKLELRYAAMRRWGDKALAKDAEHRKLRPRYGTIGVGGADMAPFFDYLAIEEFLSGLRKNLPLVECESLAKAAVKDAIEKWNNNGCKGRSAITLKSELHYWTGHSDTLIENMHREFYAIDKA